MGIIESANLPVSDKVYLKKDIFGWRVVQPYKNEDGSLNWTNILFGGWRNFWFSLALLAIIGFLMYSHFHDMQAIQSNYEVISADPISFCKGIAGSPQRNIKMDLNFLIINNQL